jgi:hypothetical protein
LWAVGLRGGPLACGEGCACDEEQEAGAGLHGVQPSAEPRRFG